MNVIAIIPARGGSKGVPGKNIAEIAGKPLIQYTLEVAVQCKEINRIYVSSDDEAILDKCRKYQKVRLHDRDAEIAADNSPVIDTVLSVLAQDGEDYDAILLLQPTSPLRTSQNLEEAIKTLEDDTEINSVISVCAMDDLHPARMYWLENDIMKPIIPAYEQVRRQEIPPAYYRNGCIYLVRKRAMLKQKEIMAKPIAPFVMPGSWLLNIDAPRDILVADILIREWQKGNL